MVNKWLRWLRKANMLHSKVKSPFMVYADFECILVVEYNRKQNPNESYTNEYQKHVACNYVIN